VAELLAMGANLKIMVTSRAALHVYESMNSGAAACAAGCASFILPPVESCQSILRSRCSCSAPLLSSQILNSTRKCARRHEICAGWMVCPWRSSSQLRGLNSFAFFHADTPGGRLQLLTGGARDLPQRQQTLRAAWTGAMIC